MRADMAKVLVERPRLGARFRYRRRKSGYDRKTRCRDGSDASPGTMPMRFAPSRSLNENLAPLRKFLMKNRGRAWDDVYGELRARLAPRNAIDMHVMQHLWHYVLFARPEGGGRMALVNDNGGTQLMLLPGGDCVGFLPRRGVFYVSCGARRLVFLPSTPRRRAHAPSPLR